MIECADCGRDFPNRDELDRHERETGHDVEMGHGGTEADR